MNIALAAALGVAMVLVSYRVGRRPQRHYLSTACGHSLHSKCREECKYCARTCRCDCHGVQPVFADAELRAVLLSALRFADDEPGAQVDAVLDALRHRTAKGEL